MDTIFFLRQSYFIEKAVPMKMACNYRVVLSPVALRLTASRALLLRRFHKLTV